MSTTNVTQNVSAEHAVEVLQKLQLMSVRENGGESLCDVVLVAGKNGQRVRGHRAVLAACSPYFEALFTRNMLESTASEVTLGDDVHGDFLLPLIQFCYTGNIEISAATVDELVLTASRLQLNDVVSSCYDFIGRNLDASNCLGVASLAKILSIPDLMQSAHKFTCKHFLEVSRQEEFLQLSIDRLKVLVASDELRVHSEEIVFRSVMSWVHYESDKRSKHIPALLALVRLSYLPLSVLAEDVMDICMKHACVPLFKEALNEKNVSIPSRSIKPRKFVESGLLVVWRNDVQIRIAEYSPFKDEWNVFDKTFPYRGKFAAAFFNNELKVLGGTDIIKAELDTVVSINLDTMTLSNLPSMAQKRWGLGSAALDGFLYAAGGYISGRGATDKVERYDSNDCKWSKVAPLTVGRFGFGLAVLDGRLFAVGGKNGIYLNSTECYDPETVKWTMLANLNTSRFCHGIASGNGFLYAVAGKNDTGNLNSIERYDPQANKWTEISSLGGPKGNVECVFLDDCLLVVSSLDEKCSLYQYNLVTDKWTERATLLGQKVIAQRALLK